MSKTPVPSAPGDDAQHLHPPRHWRFWLVVATLTLAGIYVLRSVLLPFVAGAAVAYFLDPLADWLERRGLSRTMATVLITMIFLLVFSIALLLLIPAIHTQITDFVHRLPGYLQALEQRVEPVVRHVKALLPPDQVAKLRDGVMSMVGDAASWGLRVVKSVLTSSLALINILSLLVVTPVVAFYLLRDWDRMVGKVDSWLPRHHVATVRSLASEINEMLAGFVRGQATVCLALGSIYAIGLSLVGLDLGLVVGLGAGMASVVPYVGAISGLVISLGLALAQFSDTLHVVLVAVVFAIGQFLEGNVLSPLLVGERIGLHPVWLIFALLAGAALFGFVGLLLAVPVAAVIGVLIRHFLARYLASPLYHGGVPPDTAAADDRVEG
ncbi:AI-2E family transporter [Insolitispirillum peregrinum]|uniref:Predicted PurR-regulated permease PerM n=1 Tax=Insolitispirillum peregrinum TaxID=80876 RepID=A0A1N7P6Q7_9PROT|nr:AI-2E family transporter [Insolitispirillum peregrinum]SIT06325.1 Predicted PurR-regulated permease PerM [Insolitispirillum peregrinum]